jgi:hypothetical protein
MAFTKAPNISTYKSESFPIIREMDSRDITSATSKDVEYLNVTIDTIANKTIGQVESVIQKRCGYEVYNQTAISSGRFIVGMKVWKLPAASTTYLFVGLDNGEVLVYTVGSGGSFGVLSTTLSTASTGFTTTSAMAFEEFLYDNNTVKICATDGAKLCTIDTGLTVVKVTDVDFPTPILSYLVFIDGYLLVVKANTGDIYNSDLNDPTAWTAGNFIAAEMYGDTITYMGRVKNYVVVMGHASTEFFYNAAIATGSPFQRNAALAQKIGLVDQNVPPVNYEDSIFFYGHAGGTSGYNGVRLYRLTESTLDVIDHPIINQRLNFTDSSGTSIITNCNMGIITFPHNGVTVLLIGNDRMSGTDDVLALNLQNKTLTKVSTDFRPLAYAKPVSAWMPSVGHLQLFPGADGAVSAVLYLDSALNQDNGGNFTFRIVTALEDFDTINRKDMHRLTLIGEKPSSSASVNVSWTDDDYQNFNTAISVDMYQELPSITRLGKFRRRALKIEGTHNQPFTLNKIEVDLNIGQS